MSAVKIIKDTITIGSGANTTQFSVESTRVVGNDDAVYSKDRSAWERVPRGFVVIEAGQLPSPLGLEVEPPTIVAQVQGLRKFGYRTDTCYGHHEKVVTVVAMDKENGENAQIAAFTMDNREPPESIVVIQTEDGPVVTDAPSPVREPIRYWVVGSKHVHVVFRHGHIEDLELYKHNSRYTYALRIADLFNRVVLMNEAVDALEFHAWLAEYKFTAIAEAIMMSSQHIVDYGHDQLRFFALTAAGPSTSGLCAKDPSSAICSFATFGLQTPWYSDAVVLKSDEYRKLVATVRERTNTEGTVMYGMDSAGRVCAMWKEKGAEYVLERAARESILGGGNRVALNKRLRERTADLIADGYNPDVVNEWFARREPYLQKFRSWLIAEKKMPSGEEVSRWDVQSSWLTLQHEFAAVCDGYVAPVEKRGPVVLLLAGLPGSGKSTLARAVFVALKARGAVPRWANQDEVDSKNKRKAYLALIQEAAKDASVSHIILDKCNLDPTNRTDYTDLGLDITVAASMMHPDGRDRLFETCSARIVGRGAGHRSLKSDTKDVGGILSTMAGSAKTIGSDEAEVCIELSVLDSCETNLARLWHALDLDPMTPEELGRALDVSIAYEKTLATSTKHVLYWSVALDRSSRDALVGLIPPEALVGKTALGDVHCTMQYIGAWTDPETNVRLGAQRGKTVDVHVSAIAWNENGVAAAITSVESVNKHPHITLALAPGVKPVYSNELLAGPHSSLAVNMTLHGTVVAV